MCYYNWELIVSRFLCGAAFGFCEFEDPEATLRCMRLLNDWLIADKKLVVSDVHALTEVPILTYLSVNGNCTSAGRYEVGSVVWMLVFNFYTSVMLVGDISLLVGDKYRIQLETMCYCWHFRNRIYVGTYVR